MNRDDMLLNTIADLRERVAQLERRESDANWGAVIGRHLALPNLRALWPMNNPGNAGEMLDMSGHSRQLTWGAGASAGLYNNRILYANFNGTTAHLLCASEAAFNTTTIPISWGGWFWFNSVASQQVVLSKWDTAAQRSWGMDMLNGSPNTFRAYISSTGADSQVVTSSVAPSTNAWYHIVARFTPSTELAIFVNGVKSTLTSSVFASIFSSTAQVRVSSYASGAGFLNGRAALCFFCANALPDSLIAGLYRSARFFFQ